MTEEQVVEARKQKAAAQKIREQDTWVLHKLANRLRGACEGHTAQLVVQALSELLYDVTTTHGGNLANAQAYLGMVHQVRTADAKAKAAVEREETAPDTP